ncbi:hypothetical protein G647_02753 [Cladophialophora carrionii CBS 160.54]|uniref:Peptidase S9 prolyl oligopeptidase catalytic domain-containing protein n=1 Tax=Cladophialophora carrionii CBS 160.54 TaxID=1279043 RepID=V9DH28_9EURO|nr:uncharacterized protein G647_02753 [Cladophialophora carrionii CBS 160.54]ETI25976.1 hypothetical protein G647_02753 [Cladophialophora carrionii CBS 160.54]
MKSLFRPLVAAAAASIVVTTPGAAAASISNCSTQFFTQAVDHGNASAGTFQQQYQVVSHSFKPGGPILFYQQPETKVFACMELSIFPEWAAELGALVITLEHRFFGLSNPSNASDPVEKYKTLTLENVMLDAVTFVNHVKNTTSGAKDSKVIVTGGSYGGFLATVFKTNHPNVFYGSIPFAAPLRSIGANFQNPQRYNWFKWANQIYQDLSASAAHKMKFALDTLNQRFQTATNTTAIAHDLNLCSIPQTDDDLATIMALINVVAYSIPLTSYKSPVANPVGASPQKLVNETLLLNDSTDIVNAILTNYYPPSLYPCIEWNSTESANPTLQKDSFNYLLCKYFPLSSNEIPNGTIFVPTSIQTESDPTTCKNLYDLVPPTQEYVEKKYHITRDELVNARRILFAYNEMDPTTAVGIDPLPLTQDRNASRYMFTSLAAHGEEMLASYPGDKPSVIHARQVQLQTIKEWLGYQ